VPGTLLVAIVGFVVFGTIRLRERR
jgi:Sec-independent protein translocase protein TatA